MLVATVQGDEAEAVAEACHSNSNLAEQTCYYYCCCALLAAQLGLPQ